jgi:flagellar export protein FliJ
MKRYKFKLEALLKLRRFKEEQARVEIGMMRNELEKLKDRIVTQRGHIDIAADSQTKVLSCGTAARNVQFYPEFFEGKEIEIRNIKSNSIILQAAIQAKVEEWKILRGEVKVIEKLREKNFNVFRKTQNKEETKKLEEMVQLWDQSING